MFLVVSLLLIGTARANLVPNRQQQQAVRNATDVHLEYVLLDGSNPCARKCVQGGAPMICRYHFTLEYYHTLSKACYNCPLVTSDCFRPDCIPGDGNKRAVVSVNRQIPGPAIEVCKGDIIVTDVTNHLGSESTTIHWHGQHQKDYPYMDGVPYVTQCPVLPHDTFRYTFKAEQAGTHFWHSHIGMQRADGAYGALIVRVPEEEDPHVQQYDYDLTEHVMIVLDWEKETGLEKFLAHHHNDADNKPTTLLVNGLGRSKAFTAAGKNTVYTPAARFKVKQGCKYRFRVINAGFLNCPIEISVDNHTITAISSDGKDFVPVEATSLVTYAGERFDFILNANKPKDLYWIRYRGLMDCDERFKRAHQVAVLQYEDVVAGADDYPTAAVDYDSSHREGTQINALNRGVESNKTFISMPQLESLEKWDTSLKTKPDVQYYVGYDFYGLDNYHFHKAPHYGFDNFTDVNLKLLTPQFNHISMKFPTFPVLSQRNEVTNDMFCNKDTVKNQNCEENYCECTHGITVPLDAVVELILVDEGFAYEANHPLHLHGYAFRVVAMERLGPNVTVAEVQRRDRQGLIKRNLVDAPVKDTVTVPDGGYTIVRFQASNPGYWIFHCHIDFHSEIGMALVIKVGEHNQMLPVPQNFPRCGDYLPDPKTDCVGQNCDKTCDTTSFISRARQLFGEDCSKASIRKSLPYYVAMSITSVMIFL